MSKIDILRAECNHFAKEIEKMHQETIFEFESEKNKDTYGRIEATELGLNIRVNFKCIFVEREDICKLTNWLKDLYE